jgi:hypothetical protein
VSLARQVLPYHGATWVPWRQAVLQENTTQKMEMWTLISSTAIFLSTVSHKSQLPNRQYISNGHGDTNSRNYHERPSIWQKYTGNKLSRIHKSVCSSFNEAISFLFPWGRMRLNSFGTSATRDTMLSS